MKRILRATSLVAGATHVAFLVLFLWLDLPALAALNVGSVAVFAVAWRLFGAGRNNLALTLMSAEMFIHASAAVLTLGLKSGFQYYLLALVGPMAVALHAHPVRRAFAIGAIATVFQALALLLQRHPPLATLHPLMLAGLSTLNIAGTVAVMAMIATHYANLIRQSQKALRIQATTDPLTGLSNRRQLLRAARSCERGPGGERRVRCLLLCDIDHFKRVNDELGHEVGDQALQSVASILSEALRPVDSVARWGGEEFLVLLRDTDYLTALRTAERLRAAVAVAPLRLPGAPGPALTITITVGVAVIGEGESTEAAVARADVALYRGKADGRNCVRPLGDAALA